MGMGFKGFQEKMTSTEQKHKEFTVGNVWEKVMNIQNKSYLFLDYLKRPSVSQIIPITWNERMCSEKQTGKSANASHPCLI
jgi:hypothetical protein